MAQSRRGVFIKKFSNKVARNCSNVISGGIWRKIGSNKEKWNPLASRVFNYKGWSMYIKHKNWIPIHKLFNSFIP